MKQKIIRHKWLLASLFFGAVAAALSLRGTSLWPDEGITFFAICQDFPTFVRSLFNLQIGSAQCGMPLYIISEWLWTHIFGMSEVAMRSSNLVMMLPFLVYGAKTVKKLNLSPWYTAMFALNSVFIFYINDARPYALLTSMGMAFFYYAMLGDLNDRRTLVKMHICFFLGMTTHMMFLFAFFAYIARCLLLMRRGRLHVRRQFTGLLRFAPLYLLLAGYYLYVFTHAKEVDNIGFAPLTCISQILYYLAGFSGLGLNRIHLRNGDFSYLTLGSAVLLGLMLLAYVGMLIFMLASRRRPKKPIADDEACCAPTFGELMLCFLASLTMFIIGNLLINTLFWDRHCIWILPYVIVMLCLLIDAMLHSGKMVYRACAVLMAVMQLLSSGLAMLNPYHAKDDYKGVVEWFENLEESEPYTLLYMGKESTFVYYGWVGSNLIGTATTPEEAIGTKVLINNRTPEGIEATMKQYPGLYYLVLSEKDRFDYFGVYDRYEGDTSFQSFKIVRVEVE